jgi:hypothetical protein
LKIKRQSGRSSKRCFPCFRSCNILGRSSYLALATRPADYVRLFWYGSYGKAALATVLASKPGTKVSIISDHVWPDVARRSRTYRYPDSQEPFSFFPENTTADIEAVVLYSHCASALNPLLLLSQTCSRLLCGLRSLGVSLRYPTFNRDETTTDLIDPHFQKPPLTLTKTSFPSLTELHFHYIFNDLQPVHPATAAFLESIPWSQLKKLSLSDPRTPIWVLPQVYKSMINLSALRMDALGPPAFMTSSQFKILPRRTTDWRYYLAWARDVDKVTSYLAEHSLRELSLEGFDRTLCSWNFNVPRLRTLKIHTTEAMKLKFDERSHVRTGAEMHKIARSAPELEHLELDVPRLGKAYDPTAIPGIDFDIHLHGILDGITKLEKLKSLRLFPAFRNQNDREILHPNNFANPGEFRQDLTDDVVVRLFQRLREKRPTLQRLLISSDNCVVHFVKDFDPTSWDISVLGNVITVVVRQADRDYEQRQIWVGERRIRTEIRHFTHHKRYLQEFKGWGIEC